VVSLKDSICLVGADGRRILANKTNTPTGALYPTHVYLPQKMTDRQQNKTERIANYNFRCILKVFAYTLFLSISCVLFCCWNYCLGGVCFFKVKTDFF